MTRVSFHHLTFSHNLCVCCGDFVRFVQAASGHTAEEVADLKRRYREQMRELSEVVAKAFKNDKDGLQVA